MRRVEMISVFEFFWALKSFALRAPVICLKAVDVWHFYDAED